MMITPCRTRGRDRGWEMVDQGNLESGLGKMLFLHRGEAYQESKPHQIGEPAPAGPAFCWCQSKCEQEDSDYAGFSRGGRFVSPEGSVRQHNRKKG